MACWSEGVADPDNVYFPRLDIPRPLYLNEVIRKEQERHTKELDDDSK